MKKRCKLQSKGRTRASSFISETILDFKASNVILLPIIWAYKTLLWAEMERDGDMKAVLIVVMRL